MSQHRGVNSSGPDSTVPNLKEKAHSAEDGIDAFWTEKTEGLK